MPEDETMMSICQKVHDLRSQVTLMKLSSAQAPYMLQVVFSWTFVEE